jgi:hypothetical protein
MWRNYTPFWQRAGWICRRALGASPRADGANDTHHQGTQIEGMNSKISEKKDAMSQRELRWFTLVSFLLGMAGIVLVILVNNLSSVYFVYGSAYLAFAGGLACVVAALLLLTTMILAIIRLGQIRQWTWFSLLLTSLVVFFPLGTVVLLLYLFIGPDTLPAQPTQPAQSPAYVLQYPPQAPAPLPYAASQPALPAQPYEQSIHYPPYAPAPQPHAASERPVQ